MSRKSREERETVIIWSQADKTATVTTADPAIRRRMARLFGKPAEEWADCQRWVVPVASVRPRRTAAGKPTGKPFPGGAK